MNSRIVLLAVALSVVLPAAAQTPAATDAKAENKCPIQYKSFMHGKDMRVGTYLTVTYTNTSDKTISGSRFGVVIYNEIGKPRDYERMLSNAQEIKPGKGGKLSEEMPTVEIKSGGRADDQQHRNTAQVYVMKMNFSDGTSWVDDGSKKCSSSIE